MRKLRPGEALLSQWLGAWTLDPDFLGSVPRYATYWLCALGGGKSPNLSAPHCPHLYKDNNSNTHSRDCCECLDQHLAHGERYLNVIFRNYNVVVS